MPRVLVVGVGGTLGTALASHLCAAGVEVRCSDPSREQRIADAADADVVVNVAGPRVRPGLAWADYHREHVGTTASVVRSMRPGARLVHVSSTAVFGARGVKLSARSHEAPTSFPSAPYACAKLAAEMAARAIGSACGIRVVVLRPSMVYGPGIDSALSTLRRLHRRGVPLRLSPARVRQHLLHVDLFLRCVERAVDAPDVADPLLVADPFVLTNEDLAPTRALPIPALDVRLAASLHERARALGLAHSALEALAVLGIDNEFDTEPTWGALGVDPGEFRRAATFERYWDG